jgi:hypothetical protein
MMVQNRGLCMEPAKTSSDDNQLKALSGWRARYETPTPTPYSGTKLKARIGILTGLILAVAVTPVLMKGASAALMAPWLILIGFLLGMIVWDAPRISRRIRVLSPIMGALVGFFAAAILPTWDSGSTPAWFGQFNLAVGMTLALAGVLWHHYQRANGAFFLVSGATYLAAAIYFVPNPHWWPLLPAILVTYLPLARWAECDWFLRVAGFVGNVALLAPVQEALPANVLAQSWAIFALGLLYLTTMLLLVLFQNGDRRVLNRWLFVLFGVALFVASFGGYVWLAWLPVAEVLVLLALLATIYSVAGRRVRLGVRWLTLVLALAMAVLSVTTLIGRVRSGDPVWDSVYLFLFAAAIGKLVLVPAEPLYSRAPGESSVG